MFSWFGHQSRFVLCMTGHLPAFSSVFASMFLSKRVPLFPVPYTKITGSWKVIQLHGPQPRAAHVSREPLHSLQPELTATKACRLEEAALSRGDVSAVK